MTVTTPTGDKYAVVIYEDPDVTVMRHYDVTMWDPVKGHYQTREVYPTTATEYTLKVYHNNHIVRIPYASTTHGDFHVSTSREEIAAMAREAIERDQRHRHPTVIEVTV